MVLKNNTDGKTAQVQNHQLESTTSSPKSSGEANPDENIIVDLMNDVAFKHVFSQKKFRDNYLFWAQEAYDNLMQGSNLTNRFLQMAFPQQNTNQQNTNQQNTNQQNTNQQNTKTDENR